MTIDQLLAEPAGRFLDSSVAAYVMALDDVQLLPGKRVVYRLDQDYVDVPHYSTDDAAALDVAKTIRDSNLIVVLTLAEAGNLQAVHIGRGFAAPYPVKDLLDHPDYWRGRGVRAQEPTLALAICRAALLASERFPKHLAAAAGRKKGTR